MGRRIHVTALVAALATAGCGGSGSGSATSSAAAQASATGGARPAPPTTSSGAPSDSCSVVTRTQAAAALGEPVRAAIRGSASVERGVACVFYGDEVPPGTSPDIPVRHSVRVVLVAGNQAERLFNDYRSRVRAEPVRGLGDQAYYDGYASLSVLKGRKYIRIAVIGPSNVLAPEKQLARRALARL